VTVIRNWEPFANVSGTVGVIPASRESPDAVEKNGFDADWFGLITNWPAHRAVPSRCA
jgi:hypothetical protein